MLNHALRRSIRPLAVVGLGLAPIAFLATIPRAPQERRVRDEVRNSLIAQLALISPTLGPTGEVIVLPSFEGKVEGIDLWGARVGVDHWREYLVAVTRKRVFRLAGFDRPDLEALNAAMPTVQNGRFDQRAAELAFLVTPRPFSEAVVVSGLHASDDSSRLVREWRRSAPPWWPEEGTTVLSDGTRVVKVSAISRWMCSRTSASFAFIFDSAGVLMVWATRDGPTVSRMEPCE